VQRDFTWKIESQRKFTIHFEKKHFNFVINLSLKYGTFLVLSEKKVVFHANNCLFETAQNPDVNEELRRKLT